jgi:hypothetical protein
MVGWFLRRTGRRSRFSHASTLLPDSSYGRLRADLLARSILVAKDDHLVLTRDYTFSAWSAASTVIAGSVGGCSQHRLSLRFMGNNFVSST